MPRKRLRYFKKLLLGKVDKGESYLYFRGYLHIFGVTKCIKYNIF